jgi:hypothetical protein
MEHPAGMDPPAEDAAWFDGYTSSDQGENRSAPTTDDRVAGKRPMAMEPSPTGAAAGPMMGQRSTLDSRAPKRRRLVRIVDDDDVEEEAAPTLVRRPRAAPTSPQATVVGLPMIRLPRTSSRHDQEEQRRRRRLGEPGEGSSLRRTVVLICKFIKKKIFF